MNREIEEMMTEMAEMKEIKKTLTSWLKSEVDAGKEYFDTKTCGDVSDIIKDMAEASKECYEALYYKTIIDAMTSKDHNENYGYNHRHMANGQFAGVGKGHIVSGYRPFVDKEPYLDAYLYDPNFEERIKHHDSMGYESSNSRSWNMERTKHGEIFDNYRRARRNYHDSRSTSDKEEMDTHHMMYMQDTLKNLKAMWAEADPMLKKKMKEDFGEEIAEVLEKM